MMHLKGNKVVQQSVFLSLFSCKFDDQLSPDCMHLVVIHQVRILVFDNYQTCLVPLSTSQAIGHMSW